MPVGLLRPHPHRRPTEGPFIIERTDILVIGAGQAGLSAAYFLSRFGFHDRFVIVDHYPGPGGAWQFRWPTLTLATTNHVHDLPGYGLAESLAAADIGQTAGIEQGASIEQGARGGHELTGQQSVSGDQGMVPAATAVPLYYADFEQRFDLQVRRPVDVRRVVRGPYPDAGGDIAWAGDRGDQGAGDDLVDDRYLVAETADGSVIAARALINATGTWDQPFIPYVEGIGTFGGTQLHTHDYRGPRDFDGKRVLVIGAGISAVQLLIEISRQAHGVTVFWTSRRKPHFTDNDFTAEYGRAAVAKVDERVRAGLPPASVVSVTGLARTPTIAAAQADGLFHWHPMFHEITPTGVRWDDGDTLDVDVLFWCTGFRASLDHLAPLHLREPGGGIVMTGQLATTVAKDPRVQLVGYGPSASTIGANRAGRAAARAAIQTVEAT
ncbi:NAD(P)-binding domain-containing protein [Gordonia jinhuaensis]|uniref:Oxidoreductase n=1 Tax=Gordonia jinhuaensis TaxID=1517702 RepID=A0A916WS24_9ACTN|nr:NAD(P)-binding domain-containing protein [Gordonia jinhuaensis]GGB29281.1 putative oxidoreductase [Gordonia jinhuaensis]